MHRAKKQVLIAYVVALVLLFIVMQLTGCATYEECDSYISTPAHAMCVEDVALEREQRRQRRASAKERLTAYCKEQKKVLLCSGRSQPSCYCVPADSAREVMWRL